MGRQWHFGDSQMDGRLTIMACNVPNGQVRLILRHFIQNSFDRRTELDMTAGTIIYPRSGIETVTDYHGLERFLFRFVQVLGNSFGSNVFLRFLASFDRAIVTFVTIGPSCRFAFFSFNRDQNKGRRHHWYKWYRSTYAYFCFRGL